MFQPEELKKNEPLLWSVGTRTQVWELFCSFTEDSEHQFAPCPNLKE